MAIIQEVKLTSKASDKTGGPKTATLRMAELDGLRALAILLVISFHSWFFCNS